MEELYNFNQHTNYLCIYLQKTEVSIQIYGNLHRIPKHCNRLNEAARIIYNEQKTEILAWGDTYFKSNEYFIIYDDFMNGLYHLFKKGQSAWDADDIFFMEAVSQFLKLVVDKSIEEGWEKKAFDYRGSVDFFHYVFIIPSEWEIEIQADVIRPIFIKADLMLESDHKDRLLFISDLESICYYLPTETFRKEQITVMCRCEFVDNETSFIKIDSIKTTNTLFDIPNSMLYPKIMYFDSLLITSTVIKHGIKAYLNNNLFFKNEGTGQKKNMEIIVNKIYNKAAYMKGIHGDCVLTNRFFADTEEWGLNDLQTTLLNSILPIDICLIIDKNLYNKMKCMFSKNLVKKHVVSVIGHSSFFESDINSPLSSWVNYMLKYNITILNDITPLGTERSIFKNIHDDEIIWGTLEFVTKIIHNSNMYSIPRILPNENQIEPSSIFKYLKPNAVINIDISLKSTLLSYSILNDDGLIVKNFDYNYSTNNTWLPSLGSFYNIANETTLDISEQFILFAENYLCGNIEPILANKDLLIQIKAILIREQCSKDIGIVTHQQKYIKAFLLLYFIYIENIISLELPIAKRITKVAALQTCYSISIEKNLLDYTIGSKEDFSELLLASGLIFKNIDSKKLRIVTKGEEILSLIQPLLKLKFPVRSYFVLAQLHESYIQLTLNQVVTAFNSENEPQEAIIIKDKVISIPNIYESLCLNMWNNLIQNRSLIKLCNIHSKYCSEDEMSRLFSLKAKIEFMTNYKNYISKNILISNSDFQKFSKNHIKMNYSCDCRVSLTITDVVDISFKPILKDISLICMSSMINNDIFGEYKNIDYHFSLIHFNQNLEFLDIIIAILEEECQIFNPWQGIETECIVISKLPFQIFQPTLKHQPYLYKTFITGTLHQVYTENYALAIDRIYTRDRTIYTANKIDKNTVGVDNDRYFPLFKKGDIMSNVEVNKLFYKKKVYSISRDTMYFEIYAYKTYGTLNSDGTIATVDDTWNLVDSAELYFDGYQIDSFLPAMITFTPPKYSFTPLISFRQVGKKALPGNIINRAYNMTLRRF